MMIKDTITYNLINGEPIVDKEYLVKCRNLIIDGSIDKNTWVPILGKVHNDNEVIPINGIYKGYYTKTMTVLAGEDHIHLDNRFIDNNLQKLIDVSPDRITKEMSIALPKHELSNHSEYVCLRCIRKFVRFRSTFTFGLERKYCGKKSINNICLHQKMDLTNAPAIYYHEYDDLCKICPLHGLAYNSNGICIERPEKYYDE